MRTVDSVACSSTTVTPRVITLARLADFVELTKPKIAVMGLLVVAIGYVLGNIGAVHWQSLFQALFGIGLIAVSCSALNQYIERHSDLLMQRTANRPIPAGRIHPNEGLVFGMTSGVAGVVLLFVYTNWLTSVLGAATLIAYVGVYTPLKKRTFFSTVIGAVAGAMPPVLGWTAAGGSLGVETLLLFSILFLWQFPHFISIAWLYRVDYASAGLRMLPGVIPRRGVAGALAVAYALVLIPVTILPRLHTMAGDYYACAALVFGCVYLIASVGFWIKE
ncbi:MAG: heme o synthase, partial [Planctomycetota bacterium]|nr:heme o synthase [Planctomycetota bacterium]